MTEVKCELLMLCGSGISTTEVLESATSETSALHNYTILNLLALTLLQPFLCHHFLMSKYLSFL